VDASSPVLPEVIACIGEGRAPTAMEVARVADRICRDVAGSAFAWNDPDAARRCSERAALAALQGSD